MNTIRKCKDVDLKINFYIWRSWLERNGARLLWDMHEGWDTTGANATSRLSSCPM